MPTIRTSSILFVSNAPSIVVPFPAGSVADDICVIFTGHGYATNTPSGWTASQNLTGSNFNGAAIYKILTPADITAGSVTITFSGTYYGLVAAVTMVGVCDAWITNAYRNSAGAATRALATGGVPAAGNVVLWFGAGRANNTVTSNRGTLLQTTSNNEASGALYSETLAAAGAVTATFAYSTTPTGDFGAVVVLSDIPPGFNVSREEALAWYDPLDGLNVAKEEALAWYDAKDGFDVAKMEVLAWVDYPTDATSFSKVDLGAWFDVPDGAAFSKVEFGAWIDAPNEASFSKVDLGAWLDFVGVSTRRRNSLMMVNG